MLNAKAAMAKPNAHRLTTSSIFALVIKKIKEDIPPAKGIITTADRNKPVKTYKIYRFIQIVYRKNADYSMV